MKFNNTDILFASLLGSNVIKTVPRLTAVQNELIKHVGPSAQLLPFNSNDPKVHTLDGNPRSDVWTTSSGTPEDQQFFPLSFSIDERKTWFLLPYEPIINISGKNEIIRRKVAKSVSKEGTELTGTVKERWNQGDYEITITGALIGSIMTGSVNECFPIADFQKLLEVLINSKSIDVKCAPLELLGIGKIVIEDYSFPFTKGENAQAYEIKAYSDKDYKLLLDIND